MDLESQIGALSESVELLQKSVSCSICLEIMVNPTRTKCGHSFCYCCIMTVINHNRMANCPLCNNKINRRSVKENEKAKIMVERVLTLINSVGKDLGMDIIAHAKLPKSTQEALLSSPKVQRVLRQSKLEEKTAWQKSNLKCKNKSEKLEAKEKQHEKPVEHASISQETPSSPNEKKGTKEKERVKTPELVSISQILPLSPPTTDEKVSCSIQKNVEEVPRKKKVEEWLDKAFDPVTSNGKSFETEDKEKSGQVTVVADVHKAETKDLKSIPQQRVRCYKISKKKAMVFTDAEKITVDNPNEENNKKRKIENSDENEIEPVENAESDPYTFIGSQKTPAKPTRKSLRYKDKGNKPSSASNKIEMEKKKARIMAAKPLPVRYNESQTLSIDIYDTFDKLVVTANKIEPPAPKEEHSDSDDTVFLFRTPLEGTLEGPSNLDIHLGSLEGCDSLPDKKRNSKAGCQRRTRSKSAGTSKPSAKTETGSRNIKQMFEEPKGNITTPLSPSKKRNQTINDISLAGGDIKSILAVKNLILDDAAKEEMQVLEKENLSDVIEPATPVNISKLNSTLGTKSPGWSRISKSKKEFDKLKKAECAALNVSGGVATKRNKITDCFKKVSSDTLVIPPVEHIVNAFDIPNPAVKPVADDSPKSEKLNSTVIAGGQPQKAQDDFPKQDVSLSKQKSFSDTFSDIDCLDSPASRKRKIHINSLIALLSNENGGSGNKVTETTSPKVSEGPNTHDQNELELKEQTEQLQKENTGLNIEPQQEIDVNDQQAPSEIKVSLKDENEVKKTSLMSTSEVVKVDDRLSRNMESVTKQTGNEELQTSEDLARKTAEECTGKNKRCVIFVKRGRFNRLTKHIPFILLGKLISEKRGYAETREESQHSSQKNKDTTPEGLLINACIQTSPKSLLPPSPEKRTLEFVGCEDSQTCSFVPGSSDTIDFPNIIPLPHKKSVNVIKEDVAFFSPSQADDIPTQKFHPPPPTKKPNSADKPHKAEQKSDSNSGSKLTLSQFSNATTVKYNRSGGASIENSPETCNYSPDRSLTLLEVDNCKEIKGCDVTKLEKLSNEALSGNDSDIRIPFRGKTVNRRLDFMPQLTDPALDVSLENQIKDPRKSFKRIRSLSSSDSDSETLVLEISDVHSSGGKRVKCDGEEEDVEVVNLISSQENDDASKAKSDSDLPNSAELMARVMANIEADLAVKENRTSNDCEESEMEEDRNTPIMFTPTEYFGSQIGNSCSTDFQPNSAASSEAIILGTLQQENQFVVKPRTPAEEKGQCKLDVSPQGPSATNKTSDGDCESDEGIVQPTPSKDDSTSFRNNKTSWGPSELRSMSIGILREVLKEPEDCESHSEKPTLTQAHKTDTRSSLLNPSSMCRVVVEKPNSVKDLKESEPKLTTEAVQVEKSGCNEGPSNNFQSALKTQRAVSKTPEVPKKPPVKLCFVCSGLPAAMIAQVKSLANIVNADFSNIFTPNTTHLILKDAEDNLAYKTLKYLYAVVKKTWVVSFSWVSDSVRARRLLPEDDYEMLDSSGENGPFKARNSTDLLFTNFEFCCTEPYTDITKGQLEELLTEIGASVVNSPEEIRFRSGVYNMILVQMDAKTEEEVQYWWDKYGVITVAHEWVLDCIGRYRVIPIWPYLMSDIEEEQLQALGYPEVLLATDELEPESQA